MSRAAHAPGFHEMPLVFFTAAATTGGGLLAGHFAAWALESARWEPSRFQALVGLFALAGGIAVSLAHLGRPGRFAYALRRVGRSPLSTEVALAGITVLSAFAALALPAGLPLAKILWVPAAAAAPALLLSLGWVYRLPGQSSWRGAASLAPLLLGLSFGLLVEAGQRGGGVRLLFAAFGLLLVDLAGFVMRWKMSGWGAGYGSPSHPVLFRSRRRIFAARVVDANALPLVLMIAEMPTAAAIVLSFGILIERYSFYAHAVCRTTEAEVEQVESILRRTAEAPIRPAKPE
jgi:DMSO reductase anchor subunit